MVKERIFGSPSRKFVIEFVHVRSCKAHCSIVRKATSWFTWGYFVQRKASNPSRISWLWPLQFRFVFVDQTIFVLNMMMWMLLLRVTHFHVMCMCSRVILTYCCGNVFFDRYSCPINSNCPCWSFAIHAIITGVEGRRCSSSNGICVLMSQSVLFLLAPRDFAWSA